MKKAIKLMCLAVCIVLSFTALSGCSDYTVQTGELPDSYICQPNGKIRLQYYLASTESSKRSVNNWVAAFQKQYPDVEVQVEFSSNDVSAVPVQLAAKSIGDVFFLSEVWLYEYAAIQKVLMPLDSYLEAYNIDTSQVFSAIYNMGVINGKVYMAMRDYNHISLIYNRDLIKDAGLVDPIELDNKGEWTWDTFKAYCKQLTTEDGADRQIVGADLTLNWAPVYIPFLEGWGGKWYDTEEKKIYLYSDERVLEGLTDVVEFIQSNCVRVSGVRETPSQRSFTGYEAVFTTTTFLQMESMGNAYESRGVDWDVVSFPALPTHKVGTGATGFVVYNGTKNPDAAAALCLSLYTEEGQLAYNSQTGGSVPNVKSLAYSNVWRVPFDDKSINEEEGKNYDAWISYPEADTYGNPECVLPPDIADIVSSYMSSCIINAVDGSKSLADTLAYVEKLCNETWETLS